MKNLIRITSVLVLSFIYCLAVITGTKPLIHSDVQDLSTSTQQWILVELSINLYSHTPQTEGNINSANNLSPPAFKNSFDGFLAIVETVELLVRSDFSHYEFLSDNFLINFRKSKLLYPFHYFF